MRENLRQARIDKGMTQKQVAEYLGIGERYYRFIETNERGGDFEIWDMLEDLFSIHQRILRESSPNQFVKRNIQNVGKDT